MFEVLLITIAITLFYTLFSRIFIKPEHVRAIKKEVESLRSQANEARKQKDMQKYNELSMQSLRESQKMMKMNMKPMMITLIIFFLAFTWIGSTYSGFCVQVVQEGVQEDPSCIKADPATGAFAVKGVEHTIVVSDIVSLNGDQLAVGEVVEIGGKPYSVAKSQPSFMNILYPFYENKADFSLLLAQSPFTVPFIGTYLNWFWLYLLMAIPSSMLFRRLVGIE